MEFTITNLNTKGRSAQFIGSGGTASVTFADGPDQLQFLEITPTGNAAFLSVFAPPREGAPLPAVYSRHMGFGPGNIAISQYAGTCEPRL